MASTSGDSWMKEYSESAKLADDISHTISEKTHLLTSGVESQRHHSAIRRKITILGTRLDHLENLLAKIPSKHTITEKDLNRRKDMLSNLRSKENQMASTLNMSHYSNRDSLLGPEIKPVDAVTRTADLDDQGVVVLQRQIMREQDDGLEQLEESVISTKHIAYSVNEELTLHTRLVDDVADHAELTGSRMQSVQRTLAMLNKKTKGKCSFLCLAVSVAGVLALILAILVLLKYL